MNALATTAQASPHFTPDTPLAKAQREFSAICRKMDRDQAEADEREAAGGEA